VASAAASLYYRLDALTAHSPFSPRDALSTVILGLFLLGLGAAPMVLAEVEEGEHRE
jgi:hypothetical protein